MATSGTFLALVLLGTPVCLDSGPVRALRVCFVRHGNIYAAQRGSLVNESAGGRPTWRIGVRFGDVDLDKEYERLMEEILSGTQRSQPGVPKRTEMASRVAMEAEFKLSFARREMPEPGSGLFRYRFAKDAFYFTRSIAYGHTGSAGNYIIEQDRMLNKPTAIPRLLYLRVWPVEGPLSGEASARFPTDIVSSSLDPSIEGSRLKGVYCDFLPIGDKEMLFVLLRKEGLSFWRGKYLIKPALALYHPEWFFGLQRPCSWVLLNKTPLKCGWYEPFWLFGDERSLFLVADSGQVSLVKFLKDRSCELKPLWPAKPAPVSLIVSDTDSGRTFAFAPDTPVLSTPDRPVPAIPPRGFSIPIPGSVFEIAEKTRIFKYDDLENIPENNDSNLLRVMGLYVGLLQRQKKIGPEKAAK